MKFLSSLPAWLLAILALAGLAGPAAAIDLRERTVSSSRQFTVYCADPAARGRIASVAEELKSQFLQILGEDDRWKCPIILTLDRAPANQPNLPPATLALIEYEGGLKVQIDVHLGDDPAQVNLQQHLMRALVLEYAYRGHPAALQPGRAYPPAPWWLVEGALEIYHTRESGVDPDHYKQMVDHDRIPLLAEVLAERKEGTQAGGLEAIDRACALCVVQSLTSLPDGRASLAAYVRHLSEAPPDPLLALRRDFPNIAGNPESAQKWWTLSLARLSATARYKGLSPEETDTQLSSLLQFEVPIPAGKGSSAADHKSYGVADFEEYLKLPGSRPILAANAQALVALSTRANALYRGIVSEYEQLFALLSRGKTHGVKDRLARIAAYRESLLRRTSDISDYLNWFEATQMKPDPRAFVGYIKAANDLSAPAHRSDPISRYLDELSTDF